MTEVVTSLTIDARGATEGTATYIQAMNAAQAAVDRFLDRQKAQDTVMAGAGTVMLNAANSTGAVARAFDKLRSSLDPAHAAAKALERDIVTLDRATTHLGTSEAEVSRLLDQVVLKHDAAARAAKAQADEYRQLAQAARDAAQADQAQGAFNRQLGVGGTVPGAARASASVFETDFAQAEERARLTAQRFRQDIDTLFDFGGSAQSRGATFGALDQMLKEQEEHFRLSAMKFRQSLDGIFDFGGSARASGATFSALDEMMRDADRSAVAVARLRAEIDPLGTAQARLNTELAEYATMAQRAEISTEELAKAQALAQSRFDATAAAANRSSSPNSRLMATNAAYQVQDVFVSAAGGINAGMVALQQGPQLGMALTEALGERGAAGAASTLGAALMSIVSPVNLVTIGLVGVAAYAIQWATSASDGAKSADEAVKAYTASVEALGRAYGLTAEQAQVMFKEDETVARARVRGQQSALRDSIRDEGRSFIENFGSINQRVGVQPASEFEPFRNVLNDLNQDLKDGSINARAFIDAVNKIGADTPSLQPLVDKIFEAGEGFLGTAGKANAADEAVRRFGDDAEIAARKLEALTRRQNEFQASLAQLNGGYALALSPTEEAQKDYEAARADASTREERDDAYDAYQRRLQRIENDRAGALAPIPTARPNGEDMAAEADKAATKQTSAYDRVIESANERLDQMRQEQALFGQYGASVEIARNELQLLNQATEKGKTLSPDQKAAIHDLAVEYGNLAQAMKDAQFKADFNFDAAQLNRSEQEAAIAQRLRGTSYGMDSDVADTMRRQGTVMDQRNALTGFLSSIYESVKEGGKPIGEALLEGIAQAGMQQLDKLMESAFDSIARAVFPMPDLDFGKPTGSIVNPIYVRSADAALPGAADPVSALGKAFVSADKERDTSLKSGGVEIGIAQMGSRIFKDGEEISRLGRFSPTGLADHLSTGSAGGVDQIASYIAKAAASRGIDPNIAVRVARSEGLGEGIWQSNYSKNGFREPSFGPFQLLKGGPGTGFGRGLGNNFMDATGLDPANPANTRAGIDFALDHASKNGWGAWYGAAKAGVGKWDGIGSLDKAAQGTAQNVTRMSTDFSKSMSSVGSAATEATGGLGQLGTGLNKLGGALGQAQPGGGGGGGIGSWLSSIFSGGFSAGSPMGGAGAAQWYRAGSGGRFAGGGAIYGPGTGTSDSIPIWASNGEFMVNAAATMRYRPFLDHINRGGDLPRLAGGGPIGMPAMPRLQSPANGNLSVQVINPPGMPAMEEDSREETIDAEGNRRLKIQMREVARDEMTSPGRKGQKVQSALYGQRREPKAN